MQLFVMRHGQANPSGDIDSQRELTKKGFQEAQMMAKWFNEQAISFQHLLVSPYIRAQQTANTIINEVGYSLKSQTLNFITPSDKASEFHDYLDGQFKCADDNILIVSHMPLVSYLVAELTYDQQSPIFQTAAVAHIDYDIKTMKGQLVQLISPADLF